MEINLLNEFVLVAKYRSISRAAKELYISQPTLSCHIKNIEAQLGAELFVRESPLRLTSAGAIALKRASLICANYDEMRQEVHAAGNREETITVALNTNGTASNIAWINTQSRFNVENPRFFVHTVETKQATAADAIKIEKADCVICDIAPLRHDIQLGLSFIEIPCLTDNRLFVWAHKKSRLATKTSLHWDDLKQLTHPSNTFRFPLWAAAIKNCVESHGGSVSIIEHQAEGLTSLMMLSENEVQIFDSAYIENGLTSLVPERVFIPIDEQDALNKCWLAYDPNNASTALRQLLSFIQNQ